MPEAYQIHEKPFTIADIRPPKIVRDPNGPYVQTPWRGECPDELMEVVVDHRGRPAYTGRRKAIAVIDALGAIVAVFRIRQPRTEHMDRFELKRLWQAEYARVVRQAIAYKDNLNLSNP